MKVVFWILLMVFAILISFFPFGKAPSPYKVKRNYPRVGRTITTDSWIISFVRELISA